MIPDVINLRLPVAAASLLLLLLACSATGNPYTSDNVGLVPADNSKSRVVLFRTGESVQYGLRRATIMIDGKKTGSVARKGFLSIDLPPGQTVIKASMWDMPGSCTLTLDLAPGETSYVKVAPRTQNLGAATAGIGVGAVVTGGHPAGELTGMLLGGAIEASVTDCGGAFGLLTVTPETAASQLIGLRESR